MQNSEILNRNILFWGEDKQKILNDSSVLIAGIGGLGCVVSEILVRAGIGKIILIDNTIIEASNLNRQILFGASDIGKPKADVAKRKLQAINPELKVETIQKDITDLNQVHLPHFTGIADCLDNFAARFELEKLLQSKHFLVHGGVQNDFGQITTIKIGITQTLKEIYQGLHIPVPVPVIPQTVTAIGSLMAHEIINNLFVKPQLMNKMLILELADFSMFKVAMGK